MAPGDSGVAYDVALDKLWISRDSGSGAGQLYRYDKTGTVLSWPVPTPPAIDHCYGVATADSSFLAGDLLVTSGSNETAGTISVYNRYDYGGMVLRRTDMLAGADAIESVVLAGGAYSKCNDAHIHAGSPALNRVLRFRD